MDFESIKSSMSEKLGEENSAIISDDFVNLQTLEKSFNDKITDLEKERDSLKERNEKLVSANLNLQLKIGTEIKEPKKEDAEEDKPFNFASVFDEKGNFKK